MKRKKMSQTETDFADPGTPGKHLRYRVEYFLLLGLRAFIRILPYPVMKAVASVLGTLASWADRRGRATARQNLLAAFGDLYSSRQRSRMVGDCYRQFARTFCELFRVGNLTPELAARLCPLSFEDEAATVKAAGEGAIFITPHYANFEWLAVAWCHRGHPLTIIAQDSKNPHVTPIFIQDRSRCGNDIVSREGALLKLLRALKKGKQVALLPDLTTPPKNSAVVVRIFGLKASVTSLPASLALRTGCAVIPGISIPQPDGTYRCHFAKPIHFEPGTRMEDAAQACWDVFEPTIRENPAPWLWMYKHWRFLPAGVEPTSYPPYANRSKAFDRIDREAQV